MPGVFQSALSQLGELRVVGGNAGRETMREGTIFVSAGFDQISADLIERFPEGLGLLANVGNGTDNIALGAAAAKGIAVSNIPLGTEDTADLTMALLLATCRRLTYCEKSLRAGNWNDGNNRMGIRVHGKVLGIVGLGAIGQAVARRAKAFNMDIHYNGPNPKPDAEQSIGVHFQPKLKKLLESADIVSLNCPLTQQTRHLLNAETLQWMKQGSILINTGRGPLIEERALVAALESGRLGAVGLDVYKFEPKVTPRLLSFDNVTLLPHIGSATGECRQEMAMRLADNIRHYLRTGTPLDTCIRNP